MLIVAITPQGVSTRFFIGCEGIGAAIAADLAVHGFAVIIDHGAVTPPERSYEEVERARQILQLIVSSSGQPQ